MASLDPNAPLTDAERAELESEFDDSPDSIASELRGLDAEPSADPVLTARIMEQVRDRRVGRVRRVADFLFGQRQLRFSVAVAAPAAGIALLAVAASWLLGSGGGEPTTATVNREAAAALDQRVAVRFELPAPKASRVTVVGDFNDWNTAATDLRDDDGDGIWTVTVGLHKGRYAYKFLVDGQQWVLDPDAEAVRPDGFGGQNALLRL